MAIIGWNGFKISTSLVFRFTFTEIPNRHVTFVLIFEPFFVLTRIETCAIVRLDTWKGLAGLGSDVESAAEFSVNQIQFSTHIQALLVIQIRSGTIGMVHTKYKLNTSTRVKNNDQSNLSLVRWSICRIYDSCQRWTSMVLYHFA